MCQLLGLSANSPVSAAFSLGGFLLRGGRTDHHADGWGLGYYAQQGCHLLTDARPAIESRLVADIEARSIRAANLIAHVRRATQGPVDLRNCHPFRRRLWGRDWLFAHNGDLRDQRERPPGSFVPDGDTDSERAFCVLLNALERRFADRAPTVEALAEGLRELAGDLAAAGSFNFLLSDGDLLFAHCSTELHHLERAYPFSRAQLVDSGECIDFAQYNHADDRISVIATRPLTSDETWTAMRRGELKVFRAGRLLLDLHCAAAPSAVPAGAKSTVVVAA